MFLLELSYFLSYSSNIKKRFKEQFMQITLFKGRLAWSLSQLNR